MTTVYGVNRTIEVNNTGLIARSEKDARVKCMVDTYTQSAALTNGDVIQMLTIPAGARVVNAILQTDKSLGGTSTLTVGHAATTLFGGTAADADADAFIASTDTSSAAVTKGAVEDAGNAGMFKKFGAETTVNVTLGGSNTVSTDATISVAIFYTLD